MNELSVSNQIDSIIAQYSDWRADVLKSLRKIINTAYPDMTESVKWKMKTNPLGLPMWSCNGMVCMVQTFKNDIKLVFFKGPYLSDPNHLFNARLKSVTRAIELREGDSIDEAGITALVVEAVKFNTKP